MKTRKARTQFEVDVLPPFGQPEVVVVGPGARIAATLVGVAVAVRYLN
jgi:hypothetical protein